MPHKTDNFAPSHIPAPVWGVIATFGVVGFAVGKFLFSFRAMNRLHDTFTPLGAVLKQPIDLGPLTPIVGEFSFWAGLAFAGTAMLWAYRKARKIICSL